ncbi:MAG: hypothetical protein JJU28_09765 [Cyclobacteriaceae bacterium]|nr:hypothetical protein [Cyclobacteriaceae bacterium]
MKTLVNIFDKLPFRKVMYVLSPLLGIAFLHTGLVAQTGEDAWKAKVHMKNGMKIKGYTYEVIHGNPINLHLGTNSVAEIDTSDIQKMKTVHLGNKKNRSVFYNYAGNYGFQHHRGFYHNVFAGLSAGLEHGNVSVGFINGTWLSERFALGLGFNFDNYPSISAIPVYIQPRYYLKNDKISLFGFTDVGYAWAFQEKGRTGFYEVHNVAGGLMGQIGVGYQINFLKSALTFSMGYKLQQSRMEYEYYGWGHWSSFWPGRIMWPTQPIQAEEKRLIRRAVFTIGFTL